MKLMARRERGTVEKSGVLGALLTCCDDLDDVAMTADGRGKKPKRMGGVIHGDLRIDASIGSVVLGL